MLSAMVGLVVPFQFTLGLNPSKIVGCEGLDSTIDVSGDVAIL